NEMIDRQQRQLVTYLGRQVDGETVPGLDGLIAQAEAHLDDLNKRLESRLAERDMEHHCTAATVRHLGRAWALPPPEPAHPALAPVVRDDEVEGTAVRFVTDLLEADGWTVKSVETENRGFDLLACKCDLADHVEVRFVEVKGRAGIGEVGLTTNEYMTAERLG